MTEILIIEDEADIREILGFNIEDAGYRVHLADSAEKGLELLNSDTSLILLDVMLPGRITRQVEYMEKHPETDVCGSGMKNFGQDDSSSPGLAGHIAIASSLLLCNTMAHPTVIMRRESVKRYVERHGALYDKEYIYAEDYHLWTRMVMEGFRFDNLRDLLIKHRISPQAVTSAHAEESQKAGEKAKNEYLMYAIQEICKKGNAFEQLVDDMLKLADQHLLALQDVRQLVYVLYKRALQ